MSIRELVQTLKPDRISVPVVFGDCVLRKSSWMFAFSTLMLTHTAILPREPASDDMSRRVVNTANASGK